MPATLLQRASVRVLMIEDEKPDALMVRRSLASHFGTRIELEHAGTLAEGVRLLAESEFDAVLLDLSLPDSDRLEGIGRITQHDDEMPILVVTGLEDPQTAQEALACGAQDYLIKGQWEGRHLAHAILHAVERKAAENRLRHAAFHDEMTGLPNRRFLTQRLEARLAPDLRASEGAMGLLLVNLDGFRIVNETLGHERGDLLLVETGRRLHAAVGARGILARWSGNQFALLVEDLDNEEEGRDLAARLHEAMEPGFDLADHAMFASLSIGIAIADGGGEGRLLQQAVSAMGRAKALGRGSTALYDAEMHRQSMERIKLESALREAPIEEFVVHYQPVVSLADGAVTGFEALVRWRRPNGDLLLPGAFLDVAEASGVLRTIHAKVLRDACEFCAALPDPQTISVNLSHSCFYDTRLTDLVLGVLRESGLAARRLVLEITETVLLDEEGTEAILSGLRRLGVRVHLDDFGTGSSSLTSLRRFSLDGIKIDRSFTQDVDGRGFCVARSMVYLAAQLGLEVVAEGIETSVCAEVLRDLECGYGQGYLYGRPMPAEQAAQLARALRR
jgi:diguanylate cyclase (GGDEF)-like protein